MNQDSKKQEKVARTARAVAALQSGGVGVLPTDTLYGIVGSALDPKAVRHIYHLRKRNPKKPMIILIGDIKNLLTFGVRLSPQIKKILKKVWPGKVSVVLPIGNQKNPMARDKIFLGKFNYLHRGTGTLAFRLPDQVSLRNFLKQTGPLVAPSANFEGEPPAKTIRAAKKYFGGAIDFYSDAGRLDSKPSTIIKIEGCAITILRQGGVRISHMVNFQ